MRGKKRVKVLLLIAASVIVLACGAFGHWQWRVKTQATSLPLRPYVDVRALFGETRSYAPGDYNPEDLAGFTFNEATVFQGSEERARQILEAAKNPGLGVRALHAEGITGKGVGVAIIDQNLVRQAHPEFAGKIARYWDAGTEQSGDEGSMHAPAVASLLVGDTIGTAPGATLYFAATPTWKADSQYFADALHWIIEQNQALSAKDKIRVVSISANPAGVGSPFRRNQRAYVDAVAQAQAEGILVIDCREDDEATGFVAEGYCDPDAPEDPSRFTIGWPSRPMETIEQHKIAAPTSHRTVAEQYEPGGASYQYTGQGGLSWGIPYVAGVLAMGWQLKPELSNERMLALLHGSCHVDEHGNKIIDPPAFIEAVRNA